MNYSLGRTLADHDRPVASKEERFNGCLGEVEAGYFLLPRKGPWLTDFRWELRIFPHGKHDDEADSFSQFVKHQMLRWRWVLTWKAEHDNRLML